MLNIRVDDAFFTKQEEKHRHNLKSFIEFDNVMKSFDLHYVLGVIPSTLDEENSEYLINNHHFSIALHGINHDERFRNEFKDHETKDDIFEKIDNILEKHKFVFEHTHIYIPPHNVIDTKTVDALFELSFDAIMGGPETEQYVVDYARNLGMRFHLSEPPMTYRSF